MRITRENFPEEYEVIKAVWGMWSSGQEIGDVEKFAYYVSKERIGRTLYAEEKNKRTFIRWNESKIMTAGINEDLDSEIPCGHSVNPVLDDFLLGYAVRTTR